MESHVFFSGGDTPLYLAVSERKASTLLSAACCSVKDGNSGDYDVDHSCGLQLQHIYVITFSSKTRFRTA